MLLGFHPNGLTPYDHAKTRTQLVTAALVTAAKTWRQSTYPSVRGWVNSGLVFSDKEKGAIEPQKDTEEFQMHIAKGEEPG